MVTTLLIVYSVLCTAFLLKLKFDKDQLQSELNVQKAKFEVTIEYLETIQKVKK